MYKHPITHIRLLGVAGLRPQGHGAGLLSGRRNSENVAMHYALDYQLFSWWFGGLVVWWFGGLVVGGLVVWWFGGLVVWWFGGWVVWRLGGLVVRWFRRGFPFTLCKKHLRLHKLSLRL